MRAGLHGLMNMSSEAFVRTLNSLEKLKPGPLDDDSRRDRWLRGGLGYKGAAHRRLAGCAAPLLANSHWHLGYRMIFTGKVLTLSIFDGSVNEFDGSVSRFDGPADLFDGSVSNYT